MTAALEFSEVSKAYRDWSGAPRTLRALAVGSSRRGRRPVRWALHDVSVAVAKGHSLGLVGHNGAGKSTFLRLASNLGRPTRGTVRTHPDAASVLNLGTAFDLQLTGRENAFTALLVAGLARPDAARLVDAVLDFAELRDFDRAPVRTYSEGMKLRLAFSAIAVLEPRLLVLDEVLAVGDLSFRAKCLERIAELRHGGTSLVLASHSLEEIAGTCEQVLWLHHGAVRAHGDTTAVVEEYRQAMHDRTLAATPVGAGRDDDGPLALGRNRFGTQEATIRGVSIAGTLRDDPPTLATGDPLRVLVDLAASAEPVADPIVTVSVHRTSDEELLLDVSTAGVSLGRSVSVGRVELVVERLDLAAGEYAVNVGVFHSDWEYAYDFHYGAYPLRVEGGSGGRGRLAPPVRWVADMA